MNVSAIEKTLGSFNLFHPIVILMVGLPHDCSMGKIEQPHATSMLAKRHQKSVKNSNCKGFLWPMADISTTFQVSVENYTHTRQPKQRHTTRFI